MSWLPNPFKSTQPLQDQEDSASDAGDGSVNEDISAIGATIGRRLLGVASFLAPPPASDEDSGDTRSPTLIGIRNDLAEISGSFRSSLSLLSNFLQRNEDVRDAELEEEDQCAGVTQEVVDFVTEISERPEYWTHFPLSLNHDDFTASDAQAEHISAMEQLVPTLADLRTKLCTDMSEKQFWMIYFILLLPRLNENSLSILSTPEIIEARSTLLTMLQRKRSLRVPDPAKVHTDITSHSDVKFDQKDNASGEEVAVAGNAEASGGMQETETSEKGSAEEDANTESVDSPRQLQNEDEFSFSDLEDNDTDVSTRRSGLGQVQDGGSSSPDGSSEWVRLKEIGRRRSREGQSSFQTRDSEGEESSDWLTIDEFDNYN